MRTRDLRPSFFMNEDLCELPMAARLLFAGLWCAADREGRLEDRPKRLKLQILPCDEVDVDELLELLCARAFIHRYEADGRRLIWIPTFRKNQKCHPKESQSSLPAHPLESPKKNGASQGRTRGVPRSSQGSTKVIPGDNLGHTQQASYSVSSCTSVSSLPSEPSCTSEPSKPSEPSEKNICGASATVPVDLHPASNGSNGKPKAKPKPEPMPFLIADLLPALAETSKGRIVVEPYDTELSSTLTKLIRRMHAQGFGLTDARLAGEWIAAGGIPFQLDTFWVAKTGALIGAIAKARQWDAAGRPPLARGSPSQQQLGMSAAQTYEYAKELARQGR